MQIPTLNLRRTDYGNASEALRNVDVVIDNLRPVVEESLAHKFLTLSAETSYNRAPARKWATGSLKLHSADLNVTCHIGRGYDCDVQSKNT